ncbi:MAG: hypothetical protein IH983_10935 [Planctomycetes bacterium]|nr:hypothetical protein [Planctomycetota bacterium]
MMRKAPRHQGIKASRHQGIEASRHRGGRVAFSLIEVLLAVFILGVGVIAIAALFPAGIAQQRQSVDDTIGPIVANNALAVLRSKLRIDDFGFGSGYTVEGDFEWSRPAFFTQPATVGGSVAVSAGSISIFNTVALGPAGAITGSEIPWSLFVYGSSLPVPPIIITQGERYYPMFNEPLPGAASKFPSRPQYVWDCMFRRFQGKIMVAIFVYRVTIPGGGGVTYTVPPNYSNPTVPPLPINVDLTDTSLGFPWSGNAWDVFGELINEPADDAFIPDTDPMIDPTYNPSNANESWQAPGQWLLDQNNNVHRVLSGRRNKSDGPVELVRPVTSMPNLAVYFLDQMVTDPTTENVVTNIWYIPVEVELDTDGDGTGDLPATLTPVYVTVREL